jgi:formamidopyrimidine-DNA glycosylase
MTTKPATNAAPTTVEQQLAVALATLEAIREKARRASNAYYYRNREMCLAKRRAYTKRRRAYMRERVVCPLCGRTAQRRSLRTHQTSKRCRRERKPTAV